MGTKLAIYDDTNFYRFTWNNQEWRELQEYLPALIEY